MCGSPLAPSQQHQPETADWPHQGPLLLLQSAHQGTQSIDSCTFLRDARGGSGGVYDGQASALFGAKPVYAS